MASQGGIYIITGPSGKEYVGSSINLERRWRRHLTRLRINDHHNLHLQRTFNKHGESSLSFRVLLICKPNDLLFYEQLMIDKLSPAYNFCRVAGSSLGVKFGPLKPEHRAKIAAAHKGEKSYWFGKKRSPECIAKISLGNKGKTVSAEARAKISAAAKNMSPETRLKMSVSRTGEKNHNFGKLMSVESRAKMSAAQLGGKSYRARAVICVEAGMEFQTMRGAAAWLRENGHPKAAFPSISTACSGKLKTAYGYRWRYADAPPPMLENNFAESLVNSV